MKMLRNITASLVLIFVFCISGKSQTANEFTGALLWKISGNGLEKPSYVMGTHHLAQLSVLDDISGLKDALVDVEQVVGEIKMEDQTALGMEIQKSAMLPPEYNYETMLTKEEYSSLDSSLVAFIGYGLAQLGKMKPGIITMLYTVTSFQKVFSEIDFTTHIPMDMYFQQQATQAGKEVLGLETIEDQLFIILVSQPYERQAKNLLCLVESTDYNNEAIKKLTDLYTNADLVGLSNLMSDPSNPCPMNEEEQNMLNKNRNDKWMQNIPTIIKETPSFITVGALHIAGEDGLLYQLSKLGYTVTAVK